MAMQTEQFAQVLSSLESALASYGFQPLQGEKGAALTVNDNAAFALYAGEKGALKLQYENERVELFAADDAETLETDGKRLLVSLLPNGADERDVRYVVNEMSETLAARSMTRTRSRASFVWCSPSCATLTKRTLRSMMNSWRRNSLKITARRA